MRLLSALLLSFGNLDSRRDPVCSLFLVGHLDHGTGLSGEALNGLFRAGNLSLVIVNYFAYGICVDVLARDP